MVERIREVTTYTRNEDGEVIEMYTRMENVAAPPAETIGDYREAVIEALNILGPPTAFCPVSECEGCKVEREMAVRHLMDILDCETWDDFLALNNS